MVTKKKGPRGQAETLLARAQQQLQALGQRLAVETRAREAARPTPAPWTEMRQGRREKMYVRHHAVCEDRVTVLRTNCRCNLYSQWSLVKKTVLAKKSGGTCR